MAKFLFNAHGYAYQDSIRILRITYEAAEAALADEIDRAKDDAFVYQQSLEQGAEPEEERDEDGYLLWDKQTLLDFKVTDTEAAAQEFRKAFAITIYHTWERAAQRWVGKSKGNHADLAPKVGALGYALDSRMADLHSLANLLKHDKKGAAESLLATWPDIFFDPNDLAWAHTGGSQAIHLLPRHIEVLFEIVAASGPAFNTPTVKSSKT